MILRCNARDFFVVKSAIPPINRDGNHNYIAYLGPAYKGWPECALANKFSIKDYGSRKFVLEKYAEWLDGHIAIGVGAVYDSLVRLSILNRLGTVKALDWCENRPADYIDPGSHWCHIEILIERIHWLTDYKEEVTQERRIAA